MSPNLWDSTTTPTPRYKYYVSSRSLKRGPNEVYYKTRTSYESYEYSDTTSASYYWSHSDKYDTSYTVSLVYPSREVEINVKKLLKRMADALCKEGWIDHKLYYNEPRVVPVSLRSVRLDGRGWANKK